MLAHLDPSVELTGGPWYTDNELDTEFIKLLCNACLRLIQDKVRKRFFYSNNIPNPSQSFPKRRSHQSQPALYPISSPPEYPNAQNVLQFLKQSRITETPLSVEHVESLLNVLVLDGEVERVIHFSLHCRLLLLNLFARSLRTVPPSGIPRPSRTMQNLNPSVVQKANGNTDLAREMDVRKARARSGRIVILNWVMPLPHHGKRRAANRNTKRAILTKSQNENDESPNLATTTITKMRTKIGRRNGRSGRSRDRKNQNAESNLKTSLPPLRPILVPNPMDLPGVNGPEMPPPSQD